MDLETDPLLQGWQEPYRSRAKKNGAYFLSVFTLRLRRTEPSSAGGASLARWEHMGVTFCENVTSKKQEQRSREKHLLYLIWLTRCGERIQRRPFFFFPSFYFERSTAKEGSHRGEPRLLTDVWLLADGRFDNKTIASEVTKAVPNNEGLTDEQWDFSLYFWSFCASLKNLLILMVSVSMVWPGLLAALILIVYCINLRKKNYSSDFDDDNRVFPLLPSRGVNRFSLLFFWWCFYFTCFFSCYIFIMSTLPHFLLYSHIAIFYYFLCHDSVVQ